MKHRVPIELAGVALGFALVAALIAFSGAPWALLIPSGSPIAIAFALAGWRRRARGATPSDQDEEA